MPPLSFYVSGCVVAHDFIYIFLFLDDIIKLAKRKTNVNKGKKPRRGKVKTLLYTCLLSWETLMSLNWLLAYNLVFFCAEQKPKL